MESKELKVFNYLNNEVRVVTKEDEPWFVAADVCKVLEIGDTHKAMDRLDDDEKGRSSIPTPGGNQEMSTVNEPGLYSLVLGSRKKEAKAFKRWVTHEVIPTIRKHGVYMTDRAIEQTIQDPDYIIGIVQALKREKNKRLALEAEKTVMLPKADYYDKYMESPDLINTGVIAQNYGMSAAKFNKMLERMGIQYRSGTMWILKKEYIDKGYMQSATYQREDGEIRNWNKWTPSGQKFLYDFLKEHEIIPVAERQTRRWQTNVI